MSEPHRIVFGATDVAEQYEARLCAAIFAPWADRLVAAAGVGPGDRVLDLATGTGVVARAAARAAGAAGRVVASDISPAMLVRAAATPPDAGAATIEHLEAAADQVSAPDQSFDVVLCQQGLQFMSDRPAVVREARRLLRSGGTFAASVWARGHTLIPFDEYSASLARAGVEPPFPRAFERGRYGMEPSELEQLLEPFASVDVSVTELEVAWPDPRTAADAILGTPFAPLLAELAPDRRAAITEDLVRTLRDDSGRCCHPMYAALALGRA